MDRDKIRIDPSSTNWLNVLPPLSDARVLKIGANDTLYALEKCGCACVHCLCRENTWGDDAVIQRISDLELIDDCSMDLCIIDDIALLMDYDPEVNFSDLFKKISGKMGEKGTLMVAFPNGAGQFRLKFTIDAIMKESGFQKLDWFICEPSAGEPLALYPYSQNPALAKKEIKKGYIHKPSLKSLLKKTIKDLLLDTTVMFNPLFGTILIASKDPAGHSSRLMQNYQMQDPHDERGNEENIYVKWVTKHHKYKQIGRIYTEASRDDQPVAICKSSHFPYDYSWAIRQEYDALKLLSSQRDAFMKEGLVVPVPQYFGSNGIWNISVESAVRGVSISDMKMNQQQLFSFKGNIRKLLSFQIMIQNFLTENLKDISVLSPEFFTNISGKAHDHLDDPGRLDYYRTFGQHGDFTDVNILYDNETGSWGIIDWEWTLAGYPPLFDAFHLILSLGYTQVPNTQKPLLDHYFDSFIDTFFRKNLFSEYIKETLQWYCNKTGVGTDKAPLFFLDFLLYLCNKYRMSVNVPGYEAMHREMLSYAMNHMNIFLM